MINSEFLFLWLLYVPLELMLLSPQHLIVLLNGNEYKFRENADYLFAIGFNYCVHGNGYGQENAGG